MSARPGPRSARTAWAPGPRDLGAGERPGQADVVHPVEELRSEVDRALRAMTVGWPPSTVAITELVAPRSIPTALTIVISSTCGQPSPSTVVVGIPVGAGRRGFAADTDRIGAPLNPIATANGDSCRLAGLPIRSSPAGGSVRQADRRGVSPGRRRSADAARTGPGAAPARRRGPRRCGQLHQDGWPPPWSTVRCARVIRGYRENDQWIAQVVRDLLARSE